MLSSTDDVQSISRLHNLPNELLVHLMRYVDADAIIKCRQTCRRLNQLIVSNMNRMSKFSLCRVRISNSYAKPRSMFVAALYRLDQHTSDKEDDEARPWRVVHVESHRLESMALWMNKVRIVGQLILSDIIDTEFNDRLFTFLVDRATNANHSTLFCPRSIKFLGNICLRRFVTTHTSFFRS